MKNRLKLFYAYLENKQSMVYMQKILFYVGTAYGLIFPKQSLANVFFFFPNYYLTGSNKVNLDILQAVESIKPNVVMCGKSEDTFYLDDFKKYAGKFFDISAWTSNPTVRYLMYGYWSTVINKHNKKEKVVYFGSGKLFYEFLEYLDDDVIAIDLIHALDEDNKKYFFNEVKKIDKRIIINEQTKQQMVEEYDKRGVDRTYIERLQVIYNGVEVPDVVKKVPSDNLRLLFVGRDSPVKRVHLVGKIATACKQKNLPATVTLVGDVEHVVLEEDRVNCEFVGASSKVSHYYEKADVLLVTSSLEGFPLVVMEAMAYGVVPVCTDVGGIKDHIINDVNGFLIENYADEEDIVEHFVEDIERLLTIKRLEQMASRTYEYAKKNFSQERFEKEYQKLFDYTI